MNTHLIILIIGSVMVIEGLPYFLFPDKIKIYLLQIQQLDTNVMRILGLMLIVFGLVLVYLMKSKIC
ncbi:MAG: DUF2065 domain-containing protein [Candidatus Aminicenantes bacterium]|nr:DUF2065 domain-containing protein [Candidatus Aminicenantes bacterium]